MDKGITVAQCSHREIDRILLVGYGANFVLCRIFVSYQDCTRNPSDFVREMENDVRTAYDAWVRYFLTGNRIKAYRNTFPDKLVFATEATNPTGPGVDILGKQMAEFYRRCGEIPGVGGCFFLVSGPGWSHSAHLDHAGNDRGVNWVLLGRSHESSELDAGESFAII